MLFITALKNQMTEINVTNMCKTSTLKGNEH